jgi:hypothetical protein
MNRGLKYAKPDSRMHCPGDAPSVRFVVGSAGDVHLAGLPRVVGEFRGQWSIWDRCPRSLDRIHRVIYSLPVVTGDRHPGEA